MIAPFALFGIQFTFALVAYALAARWYLWPRLSPLPLEVALVPLVWVHVFRIVGGSIVAPGSVAPGVPTPFREMVGYGDMVTALLALIAVIALSSSRRHAIALAWVFLVVGTVDTVNAVIQSVRYDVFTYPLGVNWVIVTAYPALLVSSFLILVTLLGRSEPNALGEVSTEAAE